MLKAERVELHPQRLQELYPNTPVPLDHTDPYTLLVAVLTQRTVHRRARQPGDPRPFRPG